MLQYPSEDVTVTVTVTVTRRVTGSIPDALGFHLSQSMFCTDTAFLAGGPLIHKWLDVRQDVLVVLGCT